MSDDIIQVGRLWHLKLTTIMGLVAYRLHSHMFWVETNSVDGLRSRDTNDVWDFLADVRNVHQADLVDICEASCV